MNLNKKDFLKWYSELKDLREFDDVVDDCADTNYCTDCRFRVGCPIRPMFYLDDTEFEMNIQIAWIKTTEAMKDYEIFGEGFVQEKTNVSYALLQNKRRKELAEHHKYSVD